MSAQQTDKERIFTAALAIEDPAKRRAYLEAECGQDRQLLAAVELLLKHDEEAGSFIERPAVATPNTSGSRVILRNVPTFIAVGFSVTRLDQYFEIEPSVPEQPTGHNVPALVAD